VKYGIELTHAAEKELFKLNAANRKKLVEAIDELSDYPRPSGVRKLQGTENEWRIRVGLFRVLYTIDDKNRELVVFRITQRKDAYRRR
jgi:mRNA interferase RelE/StbE